MTAAAIVRGWCPGALAPMPSGDGLLVRIRPRSGALTQAQAAGIAALSARHGNGLIDLSARANLQLRGVAPDHHPALLEGLAALGLLDPGVAEEARRNILVAPFWRDGDGTCALADALAGALDHFDARDLPGKFGFAVDTGELPVLRRSPADVRIERLGDGGLIVRADGAAFGVRVTPATAATAALAMTRWFLDNGGRRRMADWLAGGGRLPPAFLECPAAQDRASAPPLPGPTPAGWLVGLAFGQTTAATLARLADSAPLRLTPWRMVLLERAQDSPDWPGVITSPDDPLLRVVACVGAPGCAQARGETRTLARALAPQVPVGGLLHVSGCVKGCAHPQPAPVTLVAQEQGFDLVRHGPANASPSLRGVAPDCLRGNPGLLNE